MKLSVEEIKELMQSLAALGLRKLEISEDDFSLKLTGKTFEAPPTAAPGQGYYQDMAAPAEQPLAAELPDEQSVVRSPIVGTFYTSPTPDSPPYVKVGDTVDAGDVLFIIESMKLMNEVTAEYGGTVEEILAQNGQAVEYGLPLMRIV